MKHPLKFVACVVAVLCAGFASMQAQSTQSSAATSSSPNAYIYVTNNPSGNTHQINGYKVATDGTLSSITGSPFDKTTNSLGALANTSHWFFASDGAFIYSFSIASNGALKRVSSVNAAQFYAFPGLVGQGLTLDHTGATLYSLALDGTGDNEFQFFSKNSNNGALTFFGSSDVNGAYGELAFTGNNQFAYGFGCFQDESHAYGFKRGSDGSLADLKLTVPIPSNPSGDYCLDAGASGPSSNLAVAMYLETSTHAPGPPAQLGVYTADSSGNLTTNSTAQNMPTTAVGTINDMEVSPSGNLLAVAGESGLQVFHFNGSNPITAYTGLLATHPITQIFWDTHNHLYGISRESGRLYVFTVTPTGHKQAPGSPHTLASPQGLAVLSK